MDDSYLSKAEKDIIDSMAEEKLKNENQDAADSISEEGLQNFYMKLLQLFYLT